MSGIRGNPLLRRVRMHARMTTLFRFRASDSAMPPAARQVAWSRPWYPSAASPDPETAGPIEGTAMPMGVEVAAAVPFAPPIAAMAAGAPDQGKPAWAAPAAPILSGSTGLSAPPVSQVYERRATVQPDPTVVRRDLDQPARTPTPRAAADAVAAIDSSEIARRAAAAEASPPAGPTAAIDDVTWRRLEMIYARHHDKQIAEQESSESPIASSGTGPPIAGVVEVQRSQAEQGVEQPVAQQRPTAVSEQTDEAQLVLPDQDYTQATVPASAHLQADQQPFERSASLAMSASAIHHGSGPAPELPVVARLMTRSEDIPQEIERRTASPYQSKATPGGGTEVVRPLLAEAVETSTGQRLPAAEPYLAADASSQYQPTRTMLADSPGGAALSPGSETGDIAQSGEQGWSQPAESQLSQPSEAAVLPVQSLSLDAAWPVQRMDAFPERASASLPYPSEAIVSQPDMDTDVALQVVRGLPPARPTTSAVEIIAPRRPRPTVSASPGTTEPKTVATKQIEFGDTAPAPVPWTEHVHPAPPTGGDQMVATEIGPLPADLWQMLKQPPPGQTTDGAESGRLTAQSAPDALPSQHVSSGPVTVAPSAPAMVQRQADPVPTGEYAQLSDVASETEPQRHATSIDINELSRRVYADIRRRLAVEWERNRRP